MTDRPKSPRHQGPVPGDAAATAAEAAPNLPEKTAEKPQGKPKEIGGPEGPEPTRYGDWERKGRCIDF